MDKSEKISQLFTLRFIVVAFILGCILWMAIIGYSIYRLYKLIEWLCVS